ncbi:hypothetical protein [Cellulomonas triticagri]|uniref:Uncharacterized protein n=1 Tax=Cellulomonas triticagri TaxID=2483352 RepID=A0A3M2JTL9_9CELL|nr:hypothetical protein [Cellulomonas triticagri]RMI14095.1 hypothetical protein EBM89_01890 [Cellulomonas triticagri]
MSTDFLTRLADVDTPAPTPDLARVQRRARALRRNRRARTVGASVGLAAVLTVGGVVLPQVGGGAPTPQAGAFPLSLGVAPAVAGEGTTECQTGWSEWVAPDAWPADPRITGAAAVLADAPWAATSAGVHLTRMDCTSALPVAVLVSEEPVRGVTVWRDVADPFPEGTDGVADVPVRGAAGRLRDLGTSAYVSWSEDGARWMASGSGLGTTDLLDVLDALRFDGDALDPGSVPSGLDAAATGATRTERETLRWTVTYGDTAPVEGADGVHRTPEGTGVTLEAMAGPQEPPEVVASYDAAGVRLVDVAGHRASFAPWGDQSTDVGGWLRWQAEGVTYVLSGGLPVEDLAALAATVTPAAVDDPSLTGLPQY